MIYGYARVSSTTQSLETQVAQLTAYGCQKIFQEKLSGRPLTHCTQFAAVLDGSRHDRQYGRGDETGPLCPHHGVGGDCRI